MATAHLYEQISRNKRNSVILIITVFLLLTMVGYCFGSIYGDPVVWLVLAAGFALFYTVISYAVGDGIVLMSMRAKPIAKPDNPQLFNVVEEMSIASGLPMPKVYLIQSAASNAFATGRSPEKASIAVTSGLLENVNREELQAIIGHEMAHIKNFDTRFAILMAVMVGAIALLCDAFWRGMRYSRGSSRGSSSKGGGQLALLIAALVLAILAPIAAKMIQLAMSRRRELLADNTSVELTRNPNALANALEKIAKDPDELDLANRGTQHLFIVNPLRAAKDIKREKAGKPVNSEKSGWFDTHPPIALRVRLLREMAHTVSPTG